MIEKSKFIGFILSFIPGLAHLYIGLKERGLIFLGMLGAGVLGTIFLGFVTYGSGQVIVLFMLGYSVLWLIAILDLFSSWRLAERKNYEKTATGSQEKIYINKEEIVSSKKSISMALSIVPGAGHMYIGYQKKGLMLMGSFFFSIFFMSWLGISLLLFLLPLIWFYSFFDAMHIAEGSKNNIEEQEIELPAIKHEWIGYGLISIGVIIIIERILYPLIPHQLRNYIQTSIVSLIFIIIGFVLLKGNKKEPEDIVENIPEESEKNTYPEYNEIVIEGESDYTED
ncbi:hypothetical protein HZF24_05465 [Sedimentibacter hydroxybenzoicus DSM 7310]|uniref:TM2 domain-containing protein n=1 Tax=Sedimentibacter hydroxybenzoicus DSM 7310 TaxID=1123245 RepID=A0A974GW13_SEDHY|nr:hypothetical protein [Sedimentibacter hydroxybenzoicus]NYB73585.1 hypothetical protein [Sedimentibacter hydroxybenzoicus DSM 7310]